MGDLLTREQWYRDHLGLLIPYTDEELELLEKETETNDCE